MAGAGQNFAQQAQDPNAMQGYMSPYMQNVVDYQKSQALRDYNIGTGLRKAQSVGQGAFGGNRQALMESEAQRSLGNQLQGITAQGSQQAFQDAQKQQQFGAQLGLQGQQGALQGLGQYGQMAGQLGQLGGQELAARQGIIQSQYGMGQQQQAMEQQKINQAMQDWANTQQYPLMQLGVMSNMLRGLPMQASTTNQYVASPNALTQGIGAAGAGASLYNALKGGKEGGLPSEFKSTGIKSYYEGDVVESTKSDLYDLPLEELDKRAKSSTSPTIKRLATAIAKEKRMGLAGGGIIAFSEGKTVNSRIKPVGEVDLAEDQADQSRLTDPNFIPPGLRYNANTEANAPINRVPKDLQYVEGTTNRKQFLNPDSSAALTATRQNLAGTGLSFEEDQAKQVLNRQLAESGVKSKGTQARTFADLSDDQKAKFFAAISGKSTAAPAAAPAAPAVSTSVPTLIHPSNGSPMKPEDVQGYADRNFKGNVTAAIDHLKNKQGFTEKQISAAPAAPAGIKVAAPGQGNINAAPSDKIMPTAGIKIPAGLEAPVDSDANKTIAQLAAEKAAYMGPDVGTQEARKTAMAERASAKDEARRAQSMRMAEFFAAWGSTPGSTISAGLTALKNKAPDFIADAREEAKIRRAINKDIAELDKIERLEKSGNYDEAAKRKKDLAKNAIDTWGKKVDYLSARESDASRERAAISSATIRSAASENKGGFKTVQDAENALDKHLKEGNAIGNTYSTSKAIVKARKADYEAGKLDDKQKTSYEESLRNVQKFENREKELRDNVNYFKQNKGMTTSSGSSSESSGVDLNNFWKQ
jgi:hypothetical protein